MKYYRIVTILITILILSNSLTYAKKKIEIDDDEDINKGKINITINHPSGSVFLISWNSGISHSPESLQKIRDILFKASPIEKGRELSVKTGKYILAMKVVVPRGDNLIQELGTAAPANILLGPYRMVIGGGIAQGVLAKKTQDVTPKYGYLGSEGIKEILFHFQQDKQDVDLWFLSEVNIIPGTTLRKNLRL